MVHDVVHNSHIQGFPLMMLKARAAVTLLLLENIKLASAYAIWHARNPAC